MFKRARNSFNCIGLALELRKWSASHRHSHSVHMAQVVGSCTVRCPTNFLHLTDAQHTHSERKSALMLRLTEYTYMYMYIYTAYECVRTYIICFSLERPVPTRANQKKMKRRDHQLGVQPPLFNKIWRRLFKNLCPSCLGHFFASLDLNFFHSTLSRSFPAIHLFIPHLSFLSSVCPFLAFHF